MTVLSSSVDSDLVQGIGARIGGEVDFFTTISERQYRRWSAGGVPGRLWLRLAGWVGHPTRLALRLLSAPRGTTFVVTTNPFFAPALAAWLGAWRGHRVVHYVFDLYPDALEAAGVIATAGFRSRVIAALTRSTQRRCNGAVYLGSSLQRHAETRHGRARRSAVIDVAADESRFTASVRVKVPPLILHYGGQLGMMHDAAALAEAVRQLQPEREAGTVGFNFRVGGARAGQLLVFAGQPGISAGPVLPAPEWRCSVHGMHVGLVSLTPAGARVCLPSKTYALFASGLAVLAVAPTGSDLAGIVDENSAGWVVDNSQNDHETCRPRDAAAVGARIAALVRYLLQNPAEVRARGQAAAQAATTRYGRTAIAGRWRQFLADIQ
jgi:hypothetical protein